MRRSSVLPQAKPWRTRPAGLFRSATAAQRRLLARRWGDSLAPSMFNHLGVPMCRAHGARGLGMLAGSPALPWTASRSLKPSWLPSPRTKPFLSRIPYFPPHQIGITNLSFSLSLAFLRHISSFLFIFVSSWLILFYFAAGPRFPLFSPFRRRRLVLPFIPLLPPRATAKKFPQKFFRPAIKRPRRALFR